jgi:hypothetical protein
MNDTILIKEQNARIAKGIEEVLAEFQEIEFAYLFGSFLNKDIFNDIDLAFYVSIDFNQYNSMKYSLKVGRLIEKKIKPRYEFDTKILNHAPILFQYEIIRTGKVIFSRNKTKRIRYEAMVLSNYLDYKETSDWFDKKFLAIRCD